MKTKKLIALFVSAIMIVGLALAIMPAMEAHGATFEVAPDDAGSLRQAIIDANANPGPDTINIPAGTYTLTISGAGEDVAATGDLDITDDLTIVGDGAGTTIIDGGKLDRVFHIHLGTVVTISDLTVAGGAAPDDKGDVSGGGIYNAGVLTMVNCTVSSNTTGIRELCTGGSGAGIYNRGVLTMVNSTVSGNWTSDAHVDSTGCNGGNGGGIYNDNVLVLNNSTVSGNWTGRGSGYGGGGPGGGLYNTRVLIMTNSTVSGNWTGDGGSSENGSDGGWGGSGGGIFNIGGLTMTNSTVNSNSTGDGGSGANGGDGGSGGGITSYIGWLAMKNSTVSGNSTGNGGPGEDGDGGDGGDGGGIFNGLGMAKLNYCTIGANQTGAGGVGSPAGGLAGEGGGIYRGGGVVEFKSTIVAENTAAGGGPDCAGTLTSYGCNLVGDDTDCSFALTPGDQVGTSADPIDPLLGPLQNNGGPAETHALLLTSPAIDAVSEECGCTTIGNGDAPEPVDQDQRGEPRPMDGDENGSFLCDIGAYEAPGPMPLGPYDQGYQEGHIRGFQEGYQAGKNTCDECDKEVVGVGGTVEPVELSELRAAEQPSSSGGSDSHVYVALGVSLAAALAISGGLLALRRRRAH